MSRLLTSLVLTLCVVHVALAQQPGTLGAIPAKSTRPPGEIVILEGMAGDKRPGAVDRKTGAQTSAEYCGIRGCSAVEEALARGQRVTGDAVRALDTEWGFIVAIFFADSRGGTSICSGVLLSARAVLTAGHCGCALGSSYRISATLDSRRPEARDLIPILGEPHLFDPRVCTKDGVGGGNDLAILVTGNPIAVRTNSNGDDPRGEPDFFPWTKYGYPNETVWQIRNMLSQNSKLTAVGYGFTNDRSIGIRMKAEIPVYSAACEEVVTWSFCTPYTEMILAEKQPRPGIRNDTCGGDSGGPVFLLTEDRAILVGITSRPAPGAQDDPQLQCGGGGIYTLLGRRSVQNWLSSLRVPPMPSSQVP